MYSIRVAGNLRDGLMQYLAESGIMSKVFFYPVHKTHFYTEELKYNVTLLLTEMISSQVLTLPIYPKLSAGEISQITGRIAEYLTKAK